MARLYFNLIPSDLNCLLVERFLPDEIAIILRHIDPLARFITPIKISFSKKKIAEYAASIGSLSLIQEAMREKCSMPVGLHNVAAQYGHLDLLKTLTAKKKHRVAAWLSQKFKPQVCIDASTSYCAALGGHTEILTWLSQNKCPPSIETLNGAAQGGHLQLFENLVLQHKIQPTLKTFKIALKKGQLEIVKWLHQKGHILPEWKDSAKLYAPVSGRLDLLLWLREQNLLTSLSESSFYFLLVSHGHLDLLKWLHQTDQVKHFEPETSIVAAQNGHLQILVWLDEIKSIYWNRRLYVAAAHRGALEILQWLDQKDPQKDHWHFDISKAAIQGGQLMTLQWLHEQTCLVDEEGYRLALRLASKSETHYQIIVWLNQVYRNKYKRLNVSAILNSNL